LLAPAAGSGLVLARETDSASKVDSQQLFVKSLAGDPSNEVNAQSYTFAPCCLGIFIQMQTKSLTWSKAPLPSSVQAKVLHAGEANYVEPNVVHRGMNLSDAAVKLFVVRIKPKDKPLVTEVPAPQQ
jgi:uncharacterized RmlC-like cupin family protein